MINRIRARFSVGDILLATLLAAFPLAFRFWIGWPASIALALMAVSISLGFGWLSLLFMCSSLVASSQVDFDSTVGFYSPLGSTCLTILIAMMMLALINLQPFFSSMRRTRETIRMAEIDEPGATVDVPTEKVDD